MDDEVLHEPFGVDSPLLATKDTPIEKDTIISIESDESSGEAAARGRKRIQARGAVVGREEKGDEGGEGGEGDERSQQSQEGGTATPPRRLHMSRKATVEALLRLARPTVPEATEDSCTSPLWSGDKVVLAKADPRYQKKIALPTLRRMARVSLPV